MGFFSKIRMQEIWLTKDSLSRETTAHVLMINAQNVHSSTTFVMNNRSVTNIRSTMTDKLFSRDGNCLSQEHNDASPNRKLN